MDDSVVLLIGPEVSICTECVAGAVFEMRGMLTARVLETVSSDTDAAATGLFEEVRE
jgi:hypothetical protein